MWQARMQTLWLSNNFSCQMTDLIGVLVVLMVFCSYLLLLVMILRPLPRYSSAVCAPQLLVRRDMSHKHFFLSLWLWFLQPQSGPWLRPRPTCVCVSCFSYTYLISQLFFQVSKMCPLICITSTPSFVSTDVSIWGPGLILSDIRGSEEALAVSCLAGWIEAPY